MDAGAIMILWKRSSGAPSACATSVLIGSACEATTMVPPRWRATSRASALTMRACISTNDSPPGKRNALACRCTTAHSGRFAARRSDSPVHAPRSLSSRPRSTRTARPRAFASGATVSRARSSGDEQIAAIFGTAARRTASASAWRRPSSERCRPRRRPGRRRGLGQRGGVQRLHAEEVDHAHGGPLLRQLVVGGERLVQRDPGRDDGEPVALTPAQRLERADGERLVLAVEARRLAARRADVDDALARRGQSHGGIGGDAVGWVEDDGLGDRAEEREVLERHLRGPVLADRDARVRAAELQVDRKSTRLNSSHSQISYAAFCLKKKH